MDIREVSCHKIISAPVDGIEDGGGARLRTDFGRGVRQAIQRRALAGGRLADEADERIAGHCEVFLQDGVK